MSGINIARTLFENYQEESRKSSVALHQANNRIKDLEKQVQDYQKIQSILQDKIRLGSNSSLEDAVRQKDITIKHLELQLKKSLQQNEELEYQIIALRSKQCPCCETNVHIDFSEKKSPLKKSSKCVKQYTNKKVGHRDYADRQLTLERIIDHKNKRIDHLSKEVTRLTAVEKDLTNKTYRLSKLLPKSHMPSEVLVDCLLKEIQSLESQIQSCNNKNDKMASLSDKTNIPDTFLGTSNSKENIPVGSKHISLDRMQEKINTSMDGKSTHNLHSLFDDINELKYVFLKENEKFQHSLNRDHMRRDVTRVEYNDIINKLNGIAEAVQNIIKVNSSYQDKQSSENEVDKVILQLQKDLQDNLELSSEYKNENECLRKKVIELTEKLLQLERDKIHSTDNSVPVVNDKLPTTRSDFKYSAQNDLEKLREQLDLKKSELDSARNYIKSQQNFILELQSSLQKSDSHVNSQPVRAARQMEIPIHRSSQVLSAPPEMAAFSAAKNFANQGFEVPSISSNDSSDSCILHSCINDKRIKESLEKKLNVSEKNIKSLENLVEHLQAQNAELIKSNGQLFVDLSKAKSEKALLEKNKDIYSSLKLRMNDLNRECDEMRDENRELCDKNARLEEEKRILEEKLQTCETERKSLNSSKSLFQIKLDEANKHNESLEENLIELQNEITSLKEENKKLKSNNLNRDYNEKILSMQQALRQKENEVDDLKEEMHALETQALQMNSYRRHFRNELKKLCDSLMEESDTNVSSAQSKAIYKAAILRSLKALLQLDINDENLTDSSNSALEEIKNQYNIYLTEVKRISELLSIKNQQREELLREYIDIDDFGEVDASLSLKRNLSGSSNSASGEESPPIIPTVSGVGSISSSVQSMPVISVASGIRTIPVVSSASRVGSIPVISTASGVGLVPVISTASGAGSASSVERVGISSGTHTHVNEERIQTENSTIRNYAGSMSEVMKTLQEDLQRQRNLTFFFVSKCVNLEQQLKSEHDFKCRNERDNAAHGEFIKEFKKQLKEKDHRISRLEQQFVTLQTEKSNVEIGMEQQKSEIEWLVNENKQLFEKVTAAETELCKYKEEKNRIINEVNHLKRELVNEKYAYAKVENEVKHLREHVAHCESSASIR